MSIDAAVASLDQPGKALGSCRVLASRNQKFPQGAVLERREHSATLRQPQLVRPALEAMLRRELGVVELPQPFPRLEPAGVEAEGGEPPLQRKLQRPVVQQRREIGLARLAAPRGRDQEAHQGVGQRGIVGASGVLGRCGDELAGPLRLGSDPLDLPGQRLAAHVGPHAGLEDLRRRIQPASRLLEPKRLPGGVPLAQHGPRREAVVGRADDRELLEQPLRHVEPRRIEQPLGLRPLRISEGAQGMIDRLRLLVAEPPAPQRYRRDVDLTQPQVACHGRRGGRHRLGSRGEVDGHRAAGVVLHRLPDYSVYADRIGLPHHAEVDAIGSSTG